MFGQKFITYTPALHAPTSPDLLAELKTFLGVSGGAEDTYLLGLISTAILHAETFCNRVIVPRAIVEIDPVVAPTYRYTLRQCPIITLTEVQVGGVVQVLGDIYQDSNTGALQMKTPAIQDPSSWSSWVVAFPSQEFGRFAGEVKVTYSAGYATLPAPIKDAIFEMAKVQRLGKDRDPSIGREEVPDVGSTEYLGFRGSTAETSQVATGVSGGLPPQFALVSGLLGPFRRHVS